ncbi:MAG: hypothetical protein AB1598_05450 [Thermodesulfobacteriota bacterium]
MADKDEMLKQVQHDEKEVSFLGKVKKYIFCMLFLIPSFVKEG